VASNDRPLRQALDALISSATDVPYIPCATRTIQGAPLTPRLTVALGALAAAGLVNFCSRLFHPEETTLMLLVWHVGGVFLLPAVAASAGGWLLYWSNGTRQTF
jgi:hypothetical protein